MQSAARHWQRVGGSQLHHTQRDVDERLWNADYVSAVQTQRPQHPEPVIRGRYSAASCRDDTKVTLHAHLGTGNNSNHHQCNNPATADQLEQRGRATATAH
jgi:hypothetical protein